VIIISKEKFVRNKPHLNIGLIAGVFIVVFAIAAGLTYLYPDTILPGYYLLTPGASSLRDSMLHTSRIFLNGVLYSSLTGVAVILILKGKKILQN
jgi:hypothetical protein